VALRRVADPHSYGTYTFYQLINGDGQCLGVLSSGTTDGSRVYGWGCNGHEDQYWFQDNLWNCSGYHPLFNLNEFDHGPYTWSAFGVSGNRTSDGTPILLWHFQYTCNNQEWAG
jgi:hypothetical protein